MMNGFSHTDIPFGVNEFLRSKDEEIRRLEKLMEPYLEEEYELYPNAEEVLQNIKNICRTIADGTEPEVFISKKHLMVHVSFEVLSLTLTAERVEALDKLVSLSEGVEISAYRGRVGFTVTVPYFADGQKAPLLKALYDMK